MALPGYSTGATNRITGQFFEETFERYALYQGFLPKRNMLSAQPKGGNRWQPVKSQLDWNVYKKNGMCAIVDCKSFQSGYFTYSSLDEKQVERALEFNRWQIPSGFVVWFRAVNKVSFFSGAAIEKAGPRTRFLPEHGTVLGRLQDFVLSPIFDPTIPPPEFY
mgnify:CR=1 FL=1